MYFLLEAFNYQIWIDLFIQYNLSSQNQIKNFQELETIISQQDIENPSMGFSILITSLDTIATLWAKRQVDIVSSNWSWAIVTVAIITCNNNNNHAYGIKMEINL